MKIKAVFFDIDGTLVDRNDMHVLAWQEAFAGIGAVLESQVVHDQIGKGADMPIPALLPGLDEAVREKLGDLHAGIFKAKYLARAQPLAHAHPLGH